MSEKCCVYVASIEFVDDAHDRNLGGKTKIFWDEGEGDRWIDKEFKRWKDSWDKEFFEDGDILITRDWKAFVTPFCEETSESMVVFDSNQSC